MSRREVLHGIAAGAALPCLAIASPDQAPEVPDALLQYEIRVLEEMDDFMYRGLWSNLRYITEEELDWRPHPQANHARWVVGHLVWFEEWIADALAGTGLYLQEKGGPTSFQEKSIEALRKRFDAARERYVKEMRALTAKDMSRMIRYVYNEERDQRQEVTLRLLLQSHTTHLAGHRYQIRYIRGTYARAHKADKARFDPW